MKKDLFQLRQVINHEFGDFRWISYKLAYPPNEFSVDFIQTYGPGAKDPFSNKAKIHLPSTKISLPNQAAQEKRLSFGGKKNRSSSEKWGTLGKIREHHSHPPLRILLLTRIMGPWHRGMKSFRVRQFLHHRPTLLSAQGLHDKGETWCPTWKVTMCNYWIYRRKNVYIVVWLWHRYQESSICSDCIVF